MPPFVHHKRNNVWVGLTDKRHEGNWTFTDGTTPPEGIMLVLVNGGSIQNCARLDSTGLYDRKCGNNLPYICMMMGSYQGRSARRIACKLMNLNQV